MTDTGSSQQPSGAPEVVAALRLVGYVSAEDHVSADGLATDRDIASDCDKCGHVGQLECWPLFRAPSSYRIITRCPACGGISEF